MGEEFALFVPAQILGCQRALQPLRRLGRQRGIGWQLALTMPLVQALHRAACLVVLHTRFRLDVVAHQIQSEGIQVTIAQCHHAAALQTEQAQQT